MRTAIKTVLIGLGSMGKNHLRALHENPDFNLIAVVDHNLDPEQIKNLPDTTIFAKDIEQLKTLEYDCAFIATSTPSHFSLAKELLGQGKHLFIEKPISTTYQEGVELDSLAQKKNLTVRIGHIERCNPVVRKLKEIMKEDGVGQPIHITTTRAGGYPRKVNDGNHVLLDLAVHDLDLVSSMIGPLNIHSTICHSTTLPGVYDAADISVTSKEGASGSVHVNWLTPTRIRNIRVTGTKGVCVADYIEQTCTLYRKDLPENMNPNGSTSAQNSNQMILEVSKEEPLKVQLCEFAKALGGHQDILATCQEASAIVKLTTDALDTAWKFDTKTSP